VVGPAPENGAVMARVLGITRDGSELRLAVAGDWKLSKGLRSIETVARAVALDPPEDVDPAVARPSGTENTYKIYAESFVDLLHVTSLPSSYGIGDLGPAAFAWVDRLHEAGQRWWQALPLGPTGCRDSPYQSLSSFAGNELLISPDGLIDDGLLRAADCAGQAFSPTVEYEKVVPFKLRMLETAWSRFSAGARPDLRPAYERFCQAHGLWLDDYALFRALKASYDSACYLEWPVELIRRTPAALAQARRELANQIELARFAQFLLARQAERLERHAQDSGVRLIGNAHQPTVVAGVPPDYFSADGQLWGNPVYGCDALACQLRRGSGPWWSWWRARSCRGAGEEGR
jgi:4-alpha-glucanotransferase